MAEGFSLPPLVDDCIQGRLDVIIRRPVLVPSLSSNQILEFRFHWWGSKFLHCPRLPIGADEFKNIFNIHCDFNGLQRYFHDAEELEIEVFVASDQAGSHIPQKVFSPKRAYNQIPKSKGFGKRKKEWKDGDYIGRFFVSNLKLNARGEYVTECSIVDNSGEVCGSLVVFMLYTSLDSIHPSVMKNTGISAIPIKENISTINSKDPKVDNITTKQKTLPQIEKESLITRCLQPKREDLSPRFISFEKDKVKTVKQPSPNSKIKNKSLKAKESPNGILKSVPCHASNYKDLTSDFTHIDQPDLKHNEKLLLSRLFSFVDSGAIRLADLPMLIQICQGRSPSMDLDSFKLQEKSNSFQQYSAMGEGKFMTPIKDHLNEFEKESQKLSLNPDREGQRMFSKSKKTVNFSGISYISDVGQVENHTKVNRVFDDEFLKSLYSAQEQMKNVDDGKKASKDFEILPNKQVITMDSNLNELQGETHTSKCNEDCGKPNVKTEASMLILKFHSIQFREKATADLKAKGPEIPKKKLVRQRSKLCYFVEVLLEFEGDNDHSQTALYVSRRMEDDNEVFFESSKIFRLIERDKYEGYLKFKVSRRRLGNRLRELVGIGIVSLHKLQCKDEEVRVILPLWLPNNDPEKNTRCKVGNVEIPLGNLHFSVAFALGRIANETSCNSPEKLAELEANYLADSFGYFYKEYANNDAHLPGKLINNNFTRVDFDHEDHDVALMKPANERSQTHPCTSEISHEPSEKIYPPVFNHGDVLSTSMKPMTIGENNDETSLSSNVQLVPTFTKDERNPMKQEVHLEILEGNNLPLLRSKDTMQTFPPSSYVEITLAPDACCRTEIEASSQSPKWNFKTDLILHLEDLKDTGYYLILKVFHCLNGLSYTSSHSGDLMLGFASVDTQFLWNSFVSLCGWIPVLNLEGSMCGEIKVSLTPRRSSSRPWSILPLIEIPSRNDQDLYTEIAQEEHLLKASDVLNQNDFIEEKYNRSKSKLTSLDDSSQSGHNDTLSLKRESEAYKKSPDNQKTSCSRTSDCEQICKNCQGLDKRKNFSEDIDKNLLSKELQNYSEVNSYASKQHSPAQVPKNSIDMSKKLLSRSTNPVLEGLQWMNHLGSYDSPCVSYLDLGSIYGRPKEQVQHIATGKDKVKISSKTKKNRIAANLNFS